MLSQTLISNNYRLQKKQAIKRLMQRQKLFLVHKAGMNALVFKNSTSLSSIFNPPQVLNWAEKQALSFKRGIIRAPSPLLHRQTKYISYFQNVVNTDGPIFYFLNFFFLISSFSIFPIFRMWCTQTDLLMSAPSTIQTRSSLWMTIIMMIMTMMAMIMVTW